MKPLDESLLRKNWRDYISYRERKTIGINTGIQALDQYLLGLGGLVTLQGTTGSGKSTLALQIIHYNLKLGYSAMMLDKENSAGRIWDRLMCQANNISSTDLAVAFAEDRERLKQYMKALFDYKLHLYTEPIRSQELVRERVVEMLDQTDKPAMLLVDSIQAMDPIDDDQRINLEKWMIFLDSLKLQSNGRLTVFVTSELNRSGYENPNVVGAGKGTNAIEYKSETLLHCSEDRETGLITLTVGKHRDGLKGAKFSLEKILADKSNPMSFTFQLMATEDIVL